MLSSGRLGTAAPQTNCQQHKRRRFKMRSSCHDIYSASSTKSCPFRGPMATSGRLFQIDRTLHSSDSVSGGLNSRQEQRDQQANDGNDDQQLNEGKPPAKPHGGPGPREGAQKRVTRAEKVRAGQMSRAHQKRAGGKLDRWPACRECLQNC